MMLLRLVARTTRLKDTARQLRFTQNTRRRFIRMIPEGYDTTRALIGWTWTVSHARLMFTWPWKGMWHRAYLGLSFWGLRHRPLHAFDLYWHESWPIVPVESFTAHSKGA